MKISDHERDKCGDCGLILSQDIEELKEEDTYCDGYSHMAYNNE